jgi:hypothetical protein
MDKQAAIQTNASGQLREIVTDAIGVLGAPPDLL